MEVLLRAIIPFLLPAVILPWPLICLRKTFHVVEGIKLKSQLNSIITISWVYIGLNLPYAVTFLIHYHSQWNQGVSDLPGVPKSFRQQSRKKITKNYEKRKKLVKVCLYSS